MLMARGPVNIVQCDFLERYHRFCYSHQLTRFLVWTMFHRLFLVSFYQSVLSHRMAFLRNLRSNQHHRYSFWLNSILIGGKWNLALGEIFDSTSRYITCWLSLAPMLAKVCGRVATYNTRLLYYLTTGQPD